MVCGTGLAGLCAEFVSAGPNGGLPHQLRLLLHLLERHHQRCGVCTHADNLWRNHAVSDRKRSGRKSYQARQKGKSETQHKLLGGDEEEVVQWPGAEICGDYAQ